MDKECSWCWINNNWILNVTICAKSCCRCVSVIVQHCLHFVLSLAVTSSAFSSRPMLPHVRFKTAISQIQSLGSPSPLAATLALPLDDWITEWTRKDDGCARVDDKCSSKFPPFCFTTAEKLHFFALRTSCWNPSYVHDDIKTPLPLQ